MLTIDLEPELEAILKKMAEQEHISVNEIIKRLLSFSLKERQEADISSIPTSENLTHELIAEKKGEHLPITQSLIGLLKNSNLDSADYKKHLEDKYL